MALGPTQDPEKIESQKEAEDEALASELDWKNFRESMFNCSHAS